MLSDRPPPNYFREISSRIFGTRREPHPPGADAIPSWRARSLVAVVVGLACAGSVHAYLERRPSLNGADFGYVARAARHLANGEDPYRVMGRDTPYGVDGPFLYPLPAALLALPLVKASAATASAVFVAISVALLAFGASASGWWRLSVLLAPPFVLSLAAANWPPLLFAAATIPALGWLGVAKANLGVIVFAYRPRWLTILAGAAVVAATLLIIPSWPQSWLSEAARSPVPHRPTLFWPLGFVGLLGLLRWRTPEGRLLAAFTVVPVSLFPYDFLLLWLTPRTRAEMIALTVSAWIAAPAVLEIGPKTPTAALTVLSVGMIVPATLIVLRHPNHGP